MIFSGTIIGSSILATTVLIFLRACTKPLRMGILGMEKVKIETRMEVDSTLLDPNKISALGIILNELFTNSMKYSFEGKPSGRISFSAKEKTGYLQIEYADDGIPMDPNVDLEHSVGFGLNLISMLIRQLNGKVTLNRISGNHFYIEVPL